MSAYVIFQAEILDPEQYFGEYVGKAGASIASAGGRLIAGGGRTEALEGEPPMNHNVVVEFPSMDAALDWYRSEEYTQIRKLRANAASTRMYVVDGTG